ncbi:MAG: class IV adenylate cyclase [Desulfobacterales bacterium]|nr:class IV adenylate cyclase [Desulfobacterales bacterium]
MSALEIEVKFFLPDIHMMRRRVKALDSIFLGAVDETNIRYETRDLAFYRERSLLRLRNADRVTLTYKAEPPEKKNDYKIHREYEVTVDDFEMMKNILLSVGFHPEQVYEKKRESYQLGDAILCLDTMPYGNFLEIEAPGREIRQTAERLGLDWNRRILMNYLEMFEWIKSELGLPFSDVTFANFQSVENDMAGLITRFEANDGIPPDL